MPLPAGGCYCFDLCEAPSALDFLQRIAEVTIRDAHSNWYRYLEAVYHGRAPRPFALGRLRFFYISSRGWRTRFPSRPSPFRDCINADQPRCARCSEEWEQHAPRPLQNLQEVAMWVSTWDYVNPDECQPSTRHPGECHYVRGLPGVLLYARNQRDGLGHAVHPGSGWVEVMRHRTNYAEGMDAFAWDLAYEGSREYEGCYLRQAPGSGVWIDAGRTTIIDASTNARPVVDVRQAIADGYDSIQWHAVGFDRNAPMLVITRPQCHQLTRARNPFGIATCLPPGIASRSGWHDRACNCSEESDTLNCMGGGDGGGA